MPDDAGTSGQPPGDDQDAAEAAAGEHPEHEAQGDSAEAEGGPGDAWAERVRRGNRLLFRLLGTEALAPKQPRKRAIVVAPAENAGCARVLILFNGNVGEIRQLPALQTYPDVHVVSLRDPERRFLLTGAHGLGEDIPGVIFTLRRVIRDLRAREVFCLGASAGGYPALRYGLEMQVRGILAFSPPTTLNIDDDPGASMTKYPQLARLYTRARGLGVDLVPLYKAQRVRPSVLALYPPAHPRDSWLAQRLRGIGGVELVALDGCDDHSTLNYTARTGQLTGFLDRLFTLAPYTVKSG